MVTSPTDKFRTTAADFAALVAGVPDVVTWARRAPVPDRCAAVLEEMLPFDDQLRESGQYGSKVDLPAGSDAQAGLLACIGRDPLAG